MRHAAASAAMPIAARAMESMARGESGKKPRAKSAPDPNTVAAAERLTQRLQTRVEIERLDATGALPLSAEPL